MPFVPLWSGTYNNLERETVKGTFNINLLDQVDLTGGRDPGETPSVGGARRGPRAARRHAVKGVG